MEISKASLVARRLFFGFADAWSHVVAGLIIGYALEYLCAYCGYDYPWVLYAPAVVMLAYRHGTLICKEEFGH